MSKFKSFLSGVLASVCTLATLFGTVQPVSAEAPKADLIQTQQATATASDDMLYFIKVGTANAFVIQSQGKTILMDSSNPTYSDYSDAYEAGHGSTESGTYVVNFLKSIGITHLDYILGTHSHWDHIGGMSDVAKSGLVNSKTVYICKNYKWVASEENKAWHSKDYFDKAVSSMKKAGAVIVKTDELNASNASNYGFTY